MVFGSREMVSGHRSMVLPGSDMPSALGLVLYDFNVLDSTGQMSSCGPVVEIQSTLLKDDKMQMASEVG